MTATAWALLAVAGLFAAGDWVAVLRQHKPLEYLCKPLTMVALIGVALALDPTDAAARTWFVVALVLSLAGDVFLMLPRNLFVAGLASFLLGHLAYIAGFWADGVGSGVLAGVAVVGIGAFAVGRPLIAGVGAKEPPLVAPVVAYMAAISVMVVSAFGTAKALAIAGALLFYASDALIGWNRFVRLQRHGPLAIIVTYHLAQAALVVSLSTAS